MRQRELAGTSGRLLRTIKEDTHENEAAGETGGDGIGPHGGSDASEDHLQRFV